MICHKQLNRWPFINVLEGVEGGGGRYREINGDGQRLDWGGELTIQCTDNVL